MVDVSGIENQILQLLGAVLSIAIMILVKQAYTWLGLKVSGENQANLNQAVNNSLTFGVTQAENVIKQKGWDHVDTKNAVINSAVQALENKFPDALSKAGLNISNPADLQKITDLMQRMIPEVFKTTSESPSTPLTETQKSVIEVNKSNVLTEMVPGLALESTPPITVVAHPGSTVTVGGDLSTQVVKP